MYVPADSTNIPFIKIRVLNERLNDRGRRLCQTLRALHHWSISADTCGSLISNANAGVGDVDDGQLDAVVSHGIAYARLFVFLESLKSCCLGECSALPDGARVLRCSVGSKV